MFVKFKCNCIVDTNSQPTLQIRCPSHGEEIRDWSSDYQSRLRVVIHWQTGRAQFALHEVDYDEHGFPRVVSELPVTSTYSTTAELSQEARKMGFNMDEVSNIFYDRYLEFKEFYPELENSQLVE